LRQFVTLTAHNLEHDCRSFSTANNDF